MKVFAKQSALCKPSVWRSWQWLWQAGRLPTAMTYFALLGQFYHDVIGNRPFCHNDQLRQQRKETQLTHLVLAYCSVKFPCNSLHWIQFKTCWFVTNSKGDSHTSRNRHADFHNLHIKWQSLQTGTEKKSLSFLSGCFSITIRPQTTMWVYFVSLSCVSCVSFVHVQHKGAAIHLLNHPRFFFLLPLHSSFLHRFIQLGCSNALWQGHDEYFRVSGPNMRLFLPRARSLIWAGQFSQLRNWDRPGSESAAILIWKEMFCIMWWPWELPLI